jgi:hypothetical protein
VAVSSKELKRGPRNGRIGAISTAAALAALVAIVEALILIFHAHECPSGWVQLDFDRPIGAASLIATVPILIVTLSSALVGFDLGNRAIRPVLRRLAVSSIAVAVILVTASAGIALALGWGVISNLSSSANGCLTF